MERLPLHRTRIVDLTMAWAGPYGTRLLADMGAEVIKVEAVNNWDPLRALAGMAPTVENVWNKSAMFNHVNRNKYACTLDLSHPRGKELFLRLVAISDVVIENYRSEVMDGLGLSYDVLRSVKTDIILVSLPSHGKTGISYGDPMAGIAAAGAVALALWHRRRTGEGQYVEVTQPPPQGNRHSSMAPHGCYPCSPAKCARGASASGGGDDRWVTIAVEDDDQFAALCRAMGQPELAADPRFADVVSRYKHQDELDAIVAAWARERTPQEVTRALQAVGVPAAPVLTVPDLFDDPHLRARGFWESVSHPEAGVWDMDGVVWRMSASPAHIRLPAPRFGEHNDYVLRDLLGLSEQEIEALAAEGVIGDQPDLAVHE
jgi:crotonobetainyl-CoA:carnitine CoA-transferase CaiB-like acyl-CoA transferase